MTAQVFILRTRTGQWSFDVQQDEESLGGGSGYEDPYEAMEAAKDAFPHLDLQMLLQKSLD